MNFSKVILSLFIFLCISAIFLKFGHILLNTILIFSLSILAVEMIIQKFTKHY